MLPWIDRKIEKIPQWVYTVLLLLCAGSFVWIGKDTLPGFDILLYICAAAAFFLAIFSAVSGGAEKARPWGRNNADW